MPKKEEGEKTSKQETSKEKPQEGAYDALAPEQKEEYLQTFLPSYHKLRDAGNIPRGPLDGPMRKAYEAGARTKAEIEEFLIKTYKEGKKVKFPEKEKGSEETKEKAGEEKEDKETKPKEGEEKEPKAKDFELPDLEKAREKGYPWVEQADKAREYLEKETQATQEEIKKLEKDVEKEQELKEAKTKLETLQNRRKRLEVLSSEEKGKDDKELNEAAYLKWENEQKQGKPDRGKEVYNDEARIELLEELQKEITPEEEPKEEKPEEKSLEDLEKDLAKKRKEYLEAKRIRGKWRRKGKIEEEERKFARKKGKEELRKIGEEYNELRTEYIRRKTEQELKEKELSGDELKTAIVENLLNEYGKENKKVEEIIASRNKEEKGRWQRFVELWRRHPYYRMGISIALGLAAIPAPLLHIPRGAFTGLGTTLGTETLAAKLGERKLIHKIAKLSRKQKRELKKIEDKEKREEREQEMLEEKLAEYSPEEFAQKVGRLYALAERKGVKLEKVGPYAALSGAIQQKGKESMEQRINQAMEKGEQNKEALLAAAIDGKLQEETREIDRYVEIAGDKERRNSIIRWSLSALLGAVVGGITSYRGLTRWWKGIKTKTSIPKEAPLVPEALPEDFAITAGKGDSVWKIAKRALEGSKQYGEEFKGLNEARKTYVIDAVKDKVAENPADFGLTDVDVLKAGQEVDLSEILNNQDMVKGFFKGAKDLTKSKMGDILEHNENIMEFHAKHPKFPITTENVDQIAAGKGEELIETAAPKAGKITAEAGKSTAEATAQSTKEAAVPPAEVAEGATQAAKEAGTTSTPEAPTAKEVEAPPEVKPEAEEIEPETPPKEAAPSPETAEDATTIAREIKENWTAKKILGEIQETFKGDRTLENVREAAHSIQKNIDKDFRLDSQIFTKASKEINKKMTELGTEPSKEKALLTALQEMMEEY